MFFQKLEKKYQDAIKALTTDEVFQERFGNDPILNELDDAKYDKLECLWELQSTLGRKIQICGKPYRPITPLMWSYLWCLDSPFVKDPDRQLTESDFDLFFYLLNNTYVDDDPLKTVTDSFGTFKKMGISIEEATNVIISLISFAFSPLKMLPARHVEGPVNTSLEIYDGDWLTALISKVHKVTGDSTETIMKNSLTSCCYYLCQFQRMNGAASICRQPTEEILRQEDERCCELIADRLIELLVLDRENREEFIKEISTPPKKE